MNFDTMQAFYERHYDNVQPDGTLFIRKGLVDRIGKYKVVINAGDHEPPHIHISLNNQQIGSYLISTGEPYHIFREDLKINSLVKLWFSRENNRTQAEKEWHKLAGASQK